MNEPNKGEGAPIPEFEIKEEGVYLFLSWKELEWIERIVQAFIKALKERKPV